MTDRNESPARNFVGLARVTEQTPVVPEEVAPETPEVPEEESAVVEEPIAEAASEEPSEDLLEADSSSDH